MAALRLLRRAVAAVAVPLFVPWISPWISRQEERILAAGDPLPSDLLGFARGHLSIRAAGEVRVLAVEVVPLPAPPWLRRLGGLVGAPALPAGLAAGRGIYVRPAWREDRLLLAHELAHVAQYQRLGGVRPFLRAYLRECVVEGYAAAPMEREAAAAAAILRELLLER